MLGRSGRTSVLVLMRVLLKKSIKQKRNERRAGDGEGD
jgi:hypothetical protein